MQLLLLDQELLRGRAYRRKAGQIQLEKDSFLTRRLLQLGDGFFGLGFIAHGNVCLGVVFEKSLWTNVSMCAR